MSRPMMIAVYVLVALFSGFGLYQAGSSGASMWNDLSFLHNARLLDEYRAAKAKQEAAAKPAPKAPVVEAVP